MLKWQRRWSAKPVLAGSSPDAIPFFKGLCENKLHLDVMYTSRLGDHLAQYAALPQSLLDRPSLSVVHILASAAAYYAFELNLQWPHHETVGIAHCSR